MKKETTTLPIQEQIKKIIILRTSSINHTIKVVDELKSKYPGSKITLLTQAVTQRIFEDNSNADEIITCKKAGDYSFSINSGLLKKLREPYYDMTVVLYRTFKSNRDFRANILSTFIRSKYKFANNFRYEWINLGVESPIISIFRSTAIILTAGIKYLTRPFLEILQKVFFNYPILIYLHLLYFIRKTWIMAKKRGRSSGIDKTEISSYSIEYPEAIKIFNRIKKDQNRDYLFTELYNLTINLLNYNRYDIASELSEIIKKKFPVLEPQTKLSLDYCEALLYFQQRKYNYADITLQKAIEVIQNMDESISKLIWNNKLDKLFNDIAYEKFKFPFETLRYKFKLNENYNFWIHIHGLFKTLTKSPRKKKFNLDFTKRKGYKKANRKLSDAEYKKMNLYLDSNPVGLSLCLTGKCNLNCGKCVRNTPFAINQRYLWEKDITAENLEKLRTFFPGLYGVRFTSAFGEPLLYPDFKDIVKELYDYGVRVGTFNTNGILLGKEMSHFLVENPMVNCFAVSLDVATEETFRKLQGKPFKRIIENIKYYMSISNNYPNLNLYFIVSKSNVDEICTYIKMAHELGVNTVLMDYLNYSLEYFKIDVQVTEGNQFNYKDEFVGKMDLSKVREEAMKMGNEFGIKLMGNFFMEYYQEDGIANDNIPLCSLPWRNLSVETDGGVRNCCWQNENLANINGCKTIDELWNNERQIRVRKGIKSNKLDDICCSSTCPVVSSGVRINWLFQ